MHAERYRVPEPTLDACLRDSARGGRVVAIGTTSVRALESAAATGELRRAAPSCSSAPASSSRWSTGC